ncbi:hypothetical protein, partial [Bacillus sp. J37]|uniref:hypothetical protein n=1 Tax=Bacillus sp. J37 TaxID=935837 RepID=UPI0005592A0F
MNILKDRKSLYLFSLLATIIFTFIPIIGIREEGNYLYFGFPAQWLGYYGDFQFSFEPLGLLLDYFVFFVVVILIVKLFKGKTKDDR